MLRDFRVTPLHVSGKRATVGLQFCHPFIIVAAECAVGLQQAVVGVFLSFYEESQIFELLSVVVNAVREELEEGSACVVAENAVCCYVALRFQRQKQHVLEEIRVFEPHAECPVVLGRGAVLGRLQLGQGGGKYVLVHGFKFRERKLPVEGKVEEIASEPDVTAFLVGRHVEAKIFDDARRAVVVGKIEVVDLQETFRLISSEAVKRGFYFRRDAGIAPFDGKTEGGGTQHSQVGREGEVAGRVPVVVAAAV